MKRILGLTLALAMLGLGACGSDDKPETETVVTRPPVKFTGTPVAMDDGLDACSLFTPKQVADLTLIKVVNTSATNSPATPGKAGAGRGCLYQSKVDSTSTTYGQVFFLVVKAVDAAEARTTFDANFRGVDFTKLDDIGDAAGFVGEQADAGTEVDAAARRDDLVVVVKCLSTPTAKGEKVSVNAVVAACAVPMLNGVLARVL